MFRGIGRSLAAVVVCACGAAASADVVIETVTIGNTGNAGEWSGTGAGGYGEDRICGAVDYVYSIGKYEVTAGQYTEFLNAVADRDTYGLYNISMWSDGYGCKIQRSGTPPANFSYTVNGDYAILPVNFVSFWDACRFANWLHNGQPTGPQGPDTTETGAYTLNGYTGQDGREIQRNPCATWAVTSEDEWYKAAYHKNDGVTGNYFDYPMSKDDVPNNGNPPDGDAWNAANFWDGDYTVGSPYWRTSGGHFWFSDSPYGTYDQGGNVKEWNESTSIGGSDWSLRGVRGGCFVWEAPTMHANWRGDPLPPHAAGYADVGFRVTELPGAPPCTDLDGDGDVDAQDLSFLLSEFSCTSGCQYDLDADGDVDAQDLAYLLAAFNT